MYDYIPQSQRKTILFITDDIRTPSGVATVSKEVILKSAHYYNWVIIGGLHNHPENGNRVDLSEDINKITGIKDAKVHQICVNGYGNADIVKAIIKIDKIDALLFITDPRYYEWLFAVERDIRREIPMIYLNIWDNYPYPKYNKSFYDSCDTLLCISKLTKNCVEQVLEEKAKNKLIKYVPHGLDENIFTIVDEDDKDLKEFKEFLYKGKSYDFSILWNSRNIRRKCTSDLLVAYKDFCDRKPKEERAKICLVLHTDPIDPNGTDLFAVVKMLFNNDPSYNIIFTDRKFDAKTMNLLYNSVDVVSLVSSNEGWGLSLTEALLTGRVILANVTGGMQDQMRFEDENGKWIDFTKDFPSNNFAKYRTTGKWAFPVFPSNTSLVGSVPTPYIYDDKVQPSDVADMLNYIYSFPKDELRKYGQFGRAWATSDEARFTSQKMTDTIISAIDETVTNYTPRKSYDLIKL